jgi:hypothetical protein
LKQADPVVQTLREARAWLERATPPERQAG